MAFFSPTQVFSDLPDDAMGRRGPAPMPANVKRLRGNPGKRPLPKQLGVYAARAPVMPDGLPTEAQAFWRRYAPKLARLGLLSEVDVAALEMAAMHWWVCQQARDVLAKEGLMRADEDGVMRKHPLLQVLRDNSAALLRYTAQFGMSPSARVNLGDIGPSPVEDPYQAFLASKKRADGDEDAPG